jgi:hypothetical protein
MAIQPINPIRANRGSEPSVDSKGLDATFRHSVATLRQCADAATQSLARVRSAQFDLFHSPTKNLDKVYVAATQAAIQASDAANCLESHTLERANDRIAPKYLASVGATQRIHDALNFDAEVLRNQLATDFQTSFELESRGEKRALGASMLRYSSTEIESLIEKLRQGANEIEASLVK